MIAFTALLILIAATIVVTSALFVLVVWLAIAAVVALVRALVCARPEQSA